MNNFIEMTNKVMRNIEGATGIKLENKSRVNEHGDCCIEFGCDDMHMGPISMGDVSNADFSESQVSAYSESLIDEVFKYQNNAACVTIIDGKKFYFSDAEKERMYKYMESGLTVMDAANQVMGYRCHLECIKC